MLPAFPPRDEIRHRAATAEILVSIPRLLSLASSDADVIVAAKSAAKGEARDRVN